MIKASTFPLNPPLSKGDLSLRSNILYRLGYGDTLKRGAAFESVPSNLRYRLGYGDTLKRGATIKRVFANIILLSYFLTSSRVQVLQFCRAIAQADAACRSLPFRQEH